MNLKNLLCRQMTSSNDERIGSKEQFIGFLSGIASGVTKLLVGHPFDTLKIRMQTEGIHGRFTGSWDCLKKTLGKEGFFAMYKGATPPLFGWSIMDSVQMGSLTTYRMLLQDSRGQLSLLDHAVAGFGCGITVSFVASPVEIIKAKLQIQYDAKSKLYTGPIDCARQLIKEDGVVKGLYRGLSGTLLFRSFFWVLWGSYEIYSRKLEEWGVEKSLIPFFSGGTCFVSHFSTSSTTSIFVECKHFTNMPSMLLHSLHRSGGKHLLDNFLSSRCNQEQAYDTTGQESTLHQYP